MSPTSEESLVISIRGYWGSPPSAMESIEHRAWTIILPSGIDQRGNKTMHLLRTAALCLPLKPPVVNIPVENAPSFVVAKHGIPKTSPHLSSLTAGLSQKGATTCPIMSPVDYEFNCNREPLPKWLMDMNPKGSVLYSHPVGSQGRLGLHMRLNLQVS